MLPGLRGSDHIGITVPSFDEAEDFLVRVLGAERVYTLAGKQSDDNWMQQQLDVHPRTKLTEIRFYRLANGTNFEVFTYDAADGQGGMPRNSDIGGHHVGLYVDDLDAALEHLRREGVEILGEPVASAGASEGQRWVYFKAPWGMYFELVSFPDGKAYEADAPVKLWHPAHPAE
ncbi:MAG TPA: VOC family protein [Candidatus Agrococcus pullicola]|uniref:VOC family protein n=1 Tax=Candidatus Agrococcus pullicola TaxID=2838429 RepID=A0A9D1YVI0_9MICO|nr:VOC family protein [Candidatus Agrococcus pullicola]